MEDISEQIISKYMIRKNQKQKKNFRDFLKHNLKDRGFDVRSETYGDVFKSENVIVGNLYQAKYVLSAHYDTCATMYFIPNFCTPKNKFIYYLYEASLILLIFGISFLLAWSVTLWTNSFWVRLLFMFFFVYFILLQMLLGKANKNNYNDNTSGVVTLIECLNKFTSEQKKDICVVFFDNEEKGLIGSRLFLKRHKSLMKDKILINIDCVSDGKYLLCGYKNVAQSSVDNLHDSFSNMDTDLMVSDAKKLIYPSDQKGFPNYLVFTACNKSRIVGLYLSRIHTSKDKIFIQENIEILSSSLVDFIDKERGDLLNE